MQDWQNRITVRLVKQPKRMEAALLLTVIIDGVGTCYGCHFYEARAGEYKLHMPFTPEPDLYDAIRVEALKLWLQHVDAAALMSGIRG